MRNDIIHSLGQKLKPVDGHIGVEIEVEGKHLPREVDGWNVVADGSLKAEEALEYVIPVPTDLNGVKKAIDDLQQAFVKRKAVYYDSVRAGVHVHLNVQQYLLKDFFRLVIAYYILEDVLVSWCGPTREGNLFCLRLRDAEWLLFQLREAIKAQNWKVLNTENIRYASLNYLSLFKYGSIEFRCMRSTPEMQNVIRWVEILLDLEEGVKVFKKPDDMIKFMSEDGELNFLNTVLPNTAYMLRGQHDLAKKLRQGVRRAQVLAFATDWNLFKAEKVNPFK